MEHSPWKVSPFESSNRTDAEQLTELRRASHAADQSDAPPEHRNDPTAVVRDNRGAIIGELGLRLAAPGSGTHASMSLVVHPRHRRRGVGRSLMRYALEKAAEGEQSSLMTIVHRQWPGGPTRSDAGREFVESFGFEVANTEVRSRANLIAVAAEDKLAATAEAASADFDTIWWVGAIPGEWIEGAAALHGTFSMEAPMGQLQVRPSTVTAEQLRRESETDAAQDTFRCGVVAVHRATRKVVGTTFLIVRAGEPADQRITLVSPEARGHRLSMRLKIENLRQLRQERPDVEWVWTENAESNAPMRRVNVQLGFEPVDFAIRYHKVW